MTRQWMCGSVAAAMLVLAAGCQDSGKIDSSSGSPKLVEDTPELMAVAQPPIADVPMPAGFSLSESGSRSFVAGGARYIDHVYKGWSDKYAVWRFYKKQMAANQWTLVRDVFLQGDIVLEFDKGSERCLITISKPTFINQTTIKVVLSLVGQMPGGPGH